MRNVSDKVVEKITAFFKIMWESKVQSDRPQVTIQYDAQRSDFVAGLLRQ